MDENGDYQILRGGWTLETYWHKDPNTTVRIKPRRYKIPYSGYVVDEDAESKRGGRKWKERNLLLLRLLQRLGLPLDYKKVSNILLDRDGEGLSKSYSHELLLIGVKGNIGAPADEDRLSSVIHAQSGRHSQKPEEVYERIERMYPRQTYLEVFARNTRLGWTSWGLEVSHPL